MKKAWVILLTVTLVLALTACGGTQPAATSDQANQNNSANATDNASNSTVMQSGSSANFDFAVTGISRYDLSNGNQAILIECSVTNKTAQEQTISSIMNVAATDTANTELTSIFSEDMVAITTELTTMGVTLTTLDGNVAAGGTLTGSVVFTGPKGTMVNTVVFAPVLSDDKITLQLGGV